MIPIRNFFCFIYVFIYVLYTFWVLVYVLGTFWIRNCAIFSTSKKFRKRIFFMFPEFFRGTENCTIPYPKCTQNVYQYPKRIQNIYKNVYKTEKISYRDGLEMRNSDLLN